MSERTAKEALARLRVDVGPEVEDPTRDPVFWDDLELLLAHVEELEGRDLVAHLRRQRSFSRDTFGPHPRLMGVVAHIRKELIEIAKKPNDLEEWIDVVLLAFDGAWRAGHEPEQIAAALAAKQAKNEARTWPDWRGVPDGEAIEHDLGPVHPSNFSEPLRATVEREHALEHLKQFAYAYQINTVPMPLAAHEASTILSHVRELEEWKANATAGLQALRKQIGELELEYRDLMVKVRAGEKSTTSAG